jgi:hypothetical protein
MKPALHHKVDHEGRGQLAAAGHDRGPGLERRLKPALLEEAGAALAVQADGGGGGRLEVLVCGAKNCVDGEEGQIINHDPNHAGLASLARRYISRAS